MAIPVIDTNRIQAMMEQLKAAATRPNGVNPMDKPLGVNPLSGEKPAAKVDFAEALKASLDQVSNAQNKAQELGKRFTLGDDSVSLSDVMIAGQKSSIAFQATIQVRNKLVSAYQDIMNMQV